MHVFLEKTKEQRGEHWFPGLKVGGRVDCRGAAQGTLGGDGSVLHRNFGDGCMTVCFSESIELNTKKSEF